MTKKIGEKFTLPLALLHTTEGAAALIEQTERQYAEGLDAIAEMITAKDKHLVLLSGPSSSGKTTTSNMLAARLDALGKKAIVISLDNFFKDKEDIPFLPDGQRDIESLRALDLPLFDKLLRKILRGEDAAFPTFDFLTGRRSEKTLDISVSSNTVFIFEGIHALNPELSSVLRPDNCMKLYIATRTDFLNEDKSVALGKHDIRLARRMVRDHHYRGTDALTTLALWKNVLQGEMDYIRPHRNLADCQINSVHAYEPMVMRAQLLQLLDEIPPTEEIVRLREKFAGLCDLPISVVPKSSLLQEFLPGNTAE